MKFSNVEISNHKTYIKISYALNFIKYLEIGNDE